MSRAEALEAYRTLPVPDTTEEHWRFTDLRGFDPDAFGRDGGQSPDGAPEAIVELDVAAIATVTETGIEISRAPAEIRFEPLDEAHERLGSLVSWQDDKFAAHNAAAWQHGLLVHVPSGLELERPLYVRVANAVEGGSLFWRLLVVAEEGARFSLIEEYVSASPSLSGYSNAVVELFVEQNAKLEYVSLQNLSRETCATPSSTGSAAASARRRERRGSRTTWPARARPRASRGRTSPTASSTSTTTRSRSTSRRTRSRTSRSRARSATRRRRSGAG